MESICEEEIDLLSLDEPTHLFFALNEECVKTGGTVKGIITLVVQQEEIQLRSLQISFLGSTFVSWYQGIGQNFHCTEKVNVLDDTLQIFPNAEIHVMNLKQGSYTFPFSYVLPKTIPGTFLDKIESDVIPWVRPENGILPRSLYGEKSNITYTIKIFSDLIEQNAKLKHLRLEHPLKVIENFELIQHAPIEKNIEQSFLFDKSVSLKLTFPMGEMGIIGSRFPLQVEMNNYSRKRIDGIKLTMFQWIKLVAGYETFQRKQAVFECSIPEFELKTAGKMKKDALIEIPSYVTPSIHQSHLIYRTYELQIQTLIGGIGSNIITSVDMILYEATERDKLINKFIFPLVVEMPVPVIDQISTPIPSEMEKDEIIPSSPRSRNMLLSNLRQQENPKRFNINSITTNDKDTTSSENDSTTRENSSHSFQNFSNASQKNLNSCQQDQQEFFKLHQKQFNDSI